MSKGSRSLKKAKDDLLTGFSRKPCFHRVAHPELVLVRKQQSTSLFTVSEALALLVALALIALVVALAMGCAGPKPQKGGSTSTTISRRHQTNVTTLAQPENPSQPAHQEVQSQQTFEYMLPSGKTLALPTAAEAVPIRITSNDRVETSIGAAQPDKARELAVRVARIRPVLWVGLAMMTLVAGALFYFGWWTKGALALGIGLLMVISAGTLPQHGAMILLVGLGIFALAALLVLYAYYKGQLDQNQNGIPDFLESKRRATAP